MGSFDFKKKKESLAVVLLFRVCYNMETVLTRGRYSIGQINHWLALNSLDFLKALTRRTIVLRARLTMERKGLSKDLQSWALIKQKAKLRGLAIEKP